MVIHSARQRDMAAIQNRGYHEENRIFPQELSRTDPYLWFSPPSFMHTKLGSPSPKTKHIRPRIDGCIRFQETLWCKIGCWILGLGVHSHCPWCGVETWNYIYIDSHFLLTRYWVWWWNWKEYDIHHSHRPYSHVEGILRVMQVSTSWLPWSWLLHRATVPDL